MGHNSVAFTLDQYAKVFARHETTMVERLDAYLESGPETMKRQESAGRVS